MRSVRLAGISKTFADGNRQAEVLRDVSFYIEGPAVVGLLGPNGAGKSVTLRIIAGLLQPDSGNVVINGEPPQRCRVGFVPATNPVFGWRRAIDDIGIGLEQAGLSRAERHRTVIEFMERFSIDLPLQQRTYGFSSGQRQFVNFARVLVGPKPPDVVILDEPWAALSSNIREELIRSIQLVRERLDVTIFVAAHSVPDAVRLCDFVVPLSAKPVTVTQDDVIKVDIPWPRSDSAAETGNDHWIERVNAVYSREASLSCS